MMKRILVTGATGFVGRHLLRRLAVAGHSLTISYRGECPHIDGVEAARLVPAGDIGPATDWREALEGCSTVIHLASPVPGSGADETVSFAVNDQGTSRLVDQATQAGVKLFISLSSLFALVENAADTVVNDRFPSQARSAYGRSKLASEAHVARFAEGGRVGVSLRPPLVFGAEAKGNWRLLQQLAASGLPVPLASAANRRSLISVENLVDAIHAVIATPPENRVSGAFIVSDDPPVTVADMFRTLREGMGRPERLVPVPARVLSALLTGIGKGQLARSLLGNLVVDMRRFQNAYSWSPPMSTVDGIRRSGAGFIALPRR